MIWVFVQARTGSSRLRGKVLAPLGDGLVIDAVMRRCELLGPPVCWTIPGDDTELAVALLRREWSYITGPEHDVLRRFAWAAVALDAEHVVRVTADCPFLDVEAGRWTIQSHLDSGADFTHYVAEGRAVEVFTREALLNADKVAPRSVTIYREHPDEWILHNPRRYTINQVKFSVDTQAELDLARSRFGNTEDYHLQH